MGADAATRGGAKKWLVPVEIQTSALDCGPAALKALLGGFGIDVRYGRLREACQIDIDGTSIDVIEDLLVRFGLDAAQYIVPVDHLLTAEARMLPCLVVTRLPTGLMHSAPALIAVRIGTFIGVEGVMISCGFSGFWPCFGSPVIRRSPGGRLVAGR